MQHESPHPHMVLPQRVAMHEQTPLLHAGSLSGQTFPQLPQLLASVNVLEQNPVPAQSTLPTGHLHTPDEQIWVEGHAVQLAPQCVASVCVLYWQAVPVVQAL